MNPKTEIGHKTFKKVSTGPSVPESFLTQSLKSKNVIVTGSNTGIGFATAETLAKMGATVVIASRDVKKAKKAADEINKKLGEERAIFIAPLNLNDLTSVTTFAEKANKIEIHYLINNAGVMGCPHDVTAQGWEVEFGVNHIGHFHLTMSLIENLKRNKARVVNLSSEAKSLISRISKVLIPTDL
jgi:retinol dehydrogenase-12